MNPAQCIGRKLDGTQCSQVSPINPPYPLHPKWPYLCPECANAPARGASRNTRGICEDKVRVAG